MSPSPGVLPNVYNPPAGFCWDQLCTDPPVVDEESEENNVDSVVSAFLQIAITQVGVPGRGVPGAGTPPGWGC